MTEEDFIAIEPGWEGVFDLAAMAGMSTTLDPDQVGGFPDPTSLQAQQMTGGDPSAFLLALLATRRRRAQERHPASALVTAG